MVKDDTLQIFSARKSKGSKKRDQQIFLHNQYYPLDIRTSGSQQLELFFDDTSQKILLPGFLAQRYQSGLSDAQKDLRFLIYEQKNAVKPVEKEDPTHAKKTPESDLMIMGSGTLSMMQLRDFLLLHNDSIDTSYVERLTELYINEARREGVNHDVAFVQMCHETDFLKYTGVVQAEQNNFCGLGTVNDHTPGESFENARKGIRAHIQHLKAYASKQELNHELVDKRFYYVQRGVAPAVEELTGRWASDSEYHHKIRKLYSRMEAFIRDETVQLPI
ncbi:MAG: glucosaminidase domain-containing protein [Bacteroidales bacterium]|nr:glucosaminidase domain-containing protein [Bacteroidales bacterium]MCF8333594.1 glucosaminidase domain-containing protein [Bacteroidales bacterium]